MEETTSRAGICSKRVQLDVPAKQQYLSLLGTCLTAMFQQAGEFSGHNEAYQIQLAVHEACVNILEHAYGDQNGRLQVSFSFDENPSSFIVDLHDSGRSFVFSGITSPEPDELQVKGYGLFLIHQLMDHVMYTPAPGHNHWRLVKYL